MESFRANISIFFPSKSFYFNKSLIVNNCLYYKFDSYSSASCLKKVLQTIYNTLKGDISSTPNIDTEIKINILPNAVLLSIRGNDLSKFRASVLTILRLVDLTLLTVKLDI